MPATVREKDHLHALSALTLNPSNVVDAVKYVAGLPADQHSELLSLADSHHVVVRALEPVRATALALGDIDLANWAAAAIAKERARIDNALNWLEKICNELEAANCPTTVMKSLDHWPDVGNDLDLYSTGDDERVVKVMQQKFGAKVESQSWGDRLAHKWNFAVEGLPELVEVHVKRLGQTGEHTALARRFVSRRVTVELNGHTFQVPAPEERIIVATLQRMYRHFYARVCDLVNTAKLIDSGALDYPELKRASEMAGIWPGVATFLVIVSDYVRQYRGMALPLPALVTSAARFGAEKVYPRARFLRVPMFPEGAALYGKQLANTALRGDVPAAFRLSLLPPLATAAAISYKLTGSDKGIW
jgi:hypothetical protein